MTEQGRFKARGAWLSLDEVEMVERLKVALGTNSSSEVIRQASRLFYEWTIGDTHASDPTAGT